VGFVKVVNYFRLSRFIVAAALLGFKSLFQYCSVSGEQKFSGKKQFSGAVCLANDFNDFGLLG